ncbi:mitochondrial carrier domain-containing protein [Haematococcus lacustris]
MASCMLAVCLLRVWHQVWRQEGAASLWKGNLATIIHRVPYSATNFAVFEATKEALEPHMESDILRRLVAGGSAGLVACTAAYPLDLVRTRLSAQRDLLPQGRPVQQYRSIRHAFTSIVRQEGWRGLYVGLGASLMQVTPSLAINFCLYDSFKIALLLCASAAGFCTSTVTFPLDVVRKRTQMVRAHPGTSLTYLQVWSLVYRQAGVRGFYAGIVPEYCKVLPGMAIAFATYEGIRAAFDVGS